MGVVSAFGASGRSPRLTVFIYVLLAAAAATCSAPASAQDPPACAPVVARVVALQGGVEVQRAGAGAWIAITRLDTQICAGDRLRASAQSRAALFVQPETLVRVDENTVMTIQQSTDEIEVELLTETVAQAVPDAKSCGAAYVITRFPKKFSVKTAHVNAAVEGTEFMVESSCRATEVTVLEGQVLSQVAASRESRSLTAGEKVTAGEGLATAFSTVVKPEDAVQWVLRYPPLSDAPDGGAAPEALRAEASLRVGRVDEALREIDDALRSNPGDSDALALRAVIQIAKNDKAAAMESAVAARDADSGNYRAWLALSYAQQAAFELERALQNAKEAQIREPDSSLILARVAELRLSLGDVRGAEESARAAVSANPNESGAHTILGFVHLSEIDIDSARADFRAAIERDSFNALPRLGLGLAMIRDGELKHGREQLEIAVALDPGSSLLRSYAGKAYYEENSKERDELAAQQFELAAQLDPRDPTSYFYDAILKVSQSRPAEALSRMRRSSALNGGRAVYRSRQLLDMDLAARGASRATIYNELGFHQLGLTEAARSLAIDPANGSAHRFLADVYATTPRHEIARASELLVSQLRQPLGAPPIQTQLANDVLFGNEFFGPSTVGLHEFNPLYVRNDVQFQLFGLVGNDDTYGDQAIVNGLHGPVSFSLSQLATDTEGHRPNSQDRSRQYNGFIQAQIGARTSGQIEITSADRDFGDLRSSFDPGFFSPVVQNDVDIESQRFGLRQVLDPSSDILVSVLRRNFRQTIEEPDPFFPLLIVDDEDVWKAEAQYLRSGSGVDFLLGTGYFAGEATTRIINPFFPIELESEPHHFNAYGYVQIEARQGWPLIQLGLSYDDLSSAIGDQSELNPKLGIIWSPIEGVGLRAGAFRVLKRQIGSDQGLEPTQLAGFNQFFDDSNGTVSEGAGLAADFAFSDSFSAGIELTRRNLEAPFDFEGDIRFLSQREDIASAYFYWLASERMSITFEPRYQDFDEGASFDRMRLTELPLSLRYFVPSGWRFAVTGTAVDQVGVFEGPISFERGSDSFWLLDGMIAYRLSGRKGTISLEARNLLDEEFRFQEVDIALLRPRYVPELQVQLRISLSF